MPFDSKPEKSLSYADLAWRLRNPDTWPANFEWDYIDCAACAMGLAWRLMSDNPLQEAFYEDLPDDTITRLVRRVIADSEVMPDADFRRIFWNLAIWHSVRASDITPDHVADAIDEFLARRLVQITAEA